MWKINKNENDYYNYLIIIISIILNNRNYRPVIPEIWYVCLWCNFFQISWKHCIDSGVTSGCRFSWVVYHT